MIYATLSGVIQAVANFINFSLLKIIPISVHSVVTTGGVLVFSALISLVMREKFTMRNGISLAIAIIAVVLAVL